MTEPALPTYAPAVLELAAQAPPGEVTDVFLPHDDGCALLAGGRCTCDPEVTLGCVLWHKPNGKQARWVKVQTFATEAAARDAIGTCGRGTGNYYAAPAGRKP